MGGRGSSTCTHLQHLRPRIYSIFAGKPHELNAIKEYGTPSIFRERARRLKQLFEKYKVRYCNQSLEGDFKTLLRRTQGWSARCNDVPHGIVEQAQNLALYRHLYKKEGQIRYDPNYQTGVRREPGAIAVESIPFMGLLRLEVHRLRARARADGKKPIGAPFAAGPRRQPRRPARPSASRDPESLLLTMVMDHCGRPDTWLG